MMIESMRGPLVVVVLGCGCGQSDASLDAKFAVPDCPSYCSEVQSSCADANAQYRDLEQCMAACDSFEVGASKNTDSSGNTLGCRIYHASTLARSMPDEYCAAAGPAGGPITVPAPGACSGDNVCESFCAIQIHACGSLDAPLPGNPRDESGNPLFQYVNINNCIANCALFDKTHAYSTASTGDSLACRLLHATSAAVTENARAECRYTGAFANGPCAGAAAP